MDCQQQGRLAAQMFSTPLLILFFHFSLSLIFFQSWQYHLYIEEMPTQLGVNELLCVLCVCVSASSCLLIALLMFKGRRAGGFSNFVIYFVLYNKQDYN